LAAQLLALGHLLIVRHTICPEHGEATHSGSPDEAQALRPTHVPGHTTLDRVAEAAQHSHDHCLARANTRERFAWLPAVDSRPVPLLVTATLPSLTAVDRAPAVAVLLLAPKNSPPWA
jgi:hypothetical protein